MIRTAIVMFLAAVALTGCDRSTSNDDLPPITPEDDVEGSVSLVRVFPSDSAPKVGFDGCIWTSPIKWSGAERDVILVLEAAGTLAALTPDGETAWQLELPAPDGERPLVLSHPVFIDESRLAITYMTTPADYEGNYDANAPRLSHRVVVLDLAARELDPDFDPVVLSAQVDGNGGAVNFRPGHYLTRPELVLGKLPGQELGNVYVTGGNTRDIQPWHGWAFEVSLDQWRDQGADAAVTGVLLTTPEPDENCGAEGSSGSRDRKCGGGLWAPAGPLLVEEEGGYHLILAPGNGQLDLARDDYANTLMKVGPGLQFDPLCDVDACADFDPDEPDPACTSSCQNLFVPRLMPGQSKPTPDGDRCDGLTLFECWQKLDYIGGSTPVRVEIGGTPVFVYPAKDGSAFLVDADHLGTMHDRHVLVDSCGTLDDECGADWAGMAVTKPTVAEAGGRDVIMIPTFMPDETHPAGVVALGLTTEDGAPKLERLWEFPKFDDAAATTRFRRHPSRMALSEDGELAWIVEVGPRGDGTGRLIALDVESGEAVFDKDMVGPGQRYTVPLVDGDRIYVPSCQQNFGPAHLEAYELVDDG